MPHRQPSGHLITRNIAILCFPPVDVLDVAGPLEAFNLANLLSAPRQPYRVQVVNAAAGVDIDTEAGIGLRGQASLHGESQLSWPIDTLIVTAGLSGIDRYPEHAIDWLRRNEEGIRRLCSVCVGAFPLARTGLLEGRRVTTHWRTAESLQQKHPDTDVDPTPIWIRDGKFYTAAGISTGIDMTLGLIAEDLGEHFAEEVAEELVLSARRGQIQPQLASSCSVAGPGFRGFHSLRAWIQANIDKDIDVGSMAKHLSMSRSTLIRYMRKGLDATPAKYVEQVRVEAARHYLDETQLPLSAIAGICGFSQVDSFRRSFRNVVGTSPAEYRKRRVR